MILAACGGRGNGEKDAEGLARAERGEGSGKWGGWTGRRGDGEGWISTGGGGGGDREGESGRGQWGGEQQGREVGNGEGDKVRRRWREGQWGRGQQGGGKGERGGDGEGEKKAQEEEISQMDMMGCLGGHRL